MIIQFNTDNIISGNREHTEPMEAYVKEQLDRFKDVRRIEIHMGDENSHKQGGNDIRCMIEVKLEGVAPLAVTTHADKQFDALKDAVAKMKTVLDKKQEKSRSY
ncbi:HPF/RaiA family ribosome-associated protein [Pollutibacter soli]|uniref:HPF/RaiA family ribosome-associated protein n=1 Tax=Pollutibacter soli TaxID=3034157 RepID=UPI003013BC67